MISNIFNPTSSIILSSQDVSVYIRQKHINAIRVQRRDLAWSSAPPSHSTVGKMICVESCTYGSRSKVQKRLSTQESVSLWKTGFNGLVRNAGCLDKSNLSSPIYICIRRQRVPGSRAALVLRLRSKLFYLSISLSLSLACVTQTAAWHQIVECAFWNLRVCEYVYPLSYPDARNTKPPRGRCNFRSSLTCLSLHPHPCTVYLHSDVLSPYRVHFLADVEEEDNKNVSLIRQSLAPLAYIFLPLDLASKRSARYEAPAHRYTYL